MDLSNLLEPLSKPVEKLLETVSKGIGTLWEPTRIRKIARAEGDAARIKAEAEIDIARMQLEGSLELQQVASRAYERISHREMRRQNNIEAIVGKAVHQLPDSVSEEEVDQDWIAQFFGFCQDVSSEEMQVIWAQLLAGEVVEPGSYSLRTLHLVRTLRQSDAVLFKRFCNYIWIMGDFRLAHFYSEETDNLLRNKELLNYLDFLHLESLGLISSGPFLSLRLEPGKPVKTSYRDKTYVLFNPADGREQKLGARLLTSIGSELALLCDVEPDEDYRNALIRGWTDAGIVVEVLQHEVLHE